MAEHTSSQFNIELENIRTQVMKMGGLVEKQIQNTLSALKKADDVVLAEVVKGDKKINQMEVSIDEECFVIIARRQPAASDLRLVLTVSRIIMDLERVGDEIKSIAKKCAILISEGRVPYGRFQPIRHMLEMVYQMLMSALDSFARLDASVILQLKEQDKLLDEEYANQIRTLITYMMEDPRTIGGVIELVFVKKSIERIGDHAKNIAEHSVYLAKGVNIRHKSISKIGKIIGEDVEKTDEA